jgi:hypothetical protein
LKELEPADLLWFWNWKWVPSEKFKEPPNNG